MRAEAGGLVVVALMAVALTLPLGCGGGEGPLRVGVLVDCTGLLEVHGDSMFAAARLPVTERDGSAGGRRVELVKGCTEIMALTLAISQTRRLIEEDGVDVVIAPAGETEGVVMRKLAAHYPDVAFILTASAAQEATLRDPRPNVFRFAADAAQTAAGLATYAYRDLGWRKAAVAFDYAPTSWDASAGFVAEFCSLGGTVESEGAFTDGPADQGLAERLARNSDGVFVTTGFVPAGVFLRAYGHKVRNPPTRLVLNGYGFGVPGALAPGVDLSGVVVGGDIPPASPRPEWRRYMHAFARAYPDRPPGIARDPLILPYYVAMEGLAHALERSDGEVGARGELLRRALRRVEFNGPLGPIRLDRRGQAVVSVHLWRVSPGGAGARPFRIVKNVEQSFAGAFTSRTPPPSPFSVRCRRGEPPVWARG